MRHQCFKEHSVFIEITKGGEKTSRMFLTFFKERRSTNYN